MVSMATRRGKTAAAVAVESCDAAMAGPRLLSPPSAGPPGSDARDRRPRYRRRSLVIPALSRAHGERHTGTDGQLHIGGAATRLSDTLAM